MITLNEITFTDYKIMLTKNSIKDLWKKLADTKTITAKYVVQRCILLAMVSKEEDKVMLTKHLLRKAFTPVTHPVKLANGRTPFDVFNTIPNASVKPYRAWGFSAGTPGLQKEQLIQRDVLGIDADKLLTEEEIDQYEKIYAEVRSGDKIVRKYSYFFTRQDLFKEYQLVQTAHAALELGNQLGADAVKDLHFTVCGVEDLDALEEVEHVLQSLKLKHVVFKEPDIGNQKTSIAVYPIAEHKRGILRSYGLLKFNNTVGKEVW